MLGRQSRRRRLHKSVAKFCQSLISSYESKAQAWAFGASIGSCAVPQPDTGGDQWNSNETGLDQLMWPWNTMKPNRKTPLSCQVSLRGFIVLAWEWLQIPEGSCWFSSVSLAAVDFSAQGAPHSITRDVIVRTGGVNWTPGDFECLGPRA